MKFLVGVVFVGVYFLCDLRLGYSIGSPVYTHFSYMWQHGSLVHLAVNVYSYTSLYMCLSKVVGRLRVVVYGYVAGVMASCGSAQAAITVGASGMIAGFVGIYVVLALLGKGLKIRDKRGFAVWLGMTGGVFVLMSLLPGVNGLNHLMGFAGGVVCGLFESVCSRK